VGAGAEVGEGLVDAMAGELAEVMGEAEETLDVGADVFFGAASAFG
jgi:hypothetical protein